MKHAKYGPSSLSYRQICPGYEKTDSGSNFFSERGTKIHNALEVNNKDGLTGFEESLYDWAHELESLAVSNQSANLLDDHREICLDVCNGLVPGEEVFGTMDRLVVFDNGNALLIDYKFGEGMIPDADINMQGISYTVGVFEKFPEIMSVDVIFIMPLLKYVTTYQFFRHELAALQLQVIATIERNKAANADFYNDKWVEQYKTGKHCRFCSNLTNCPVIANTALSLANRYDETLDIPSMVHPSEITTPKDLAIGIELSKVMKSWAESMDFHAKQLATGENPVLPEGHTLTEKAGRRSIDDILGVWDLIHEKYGVTLNDFLLQCKLSGSAVEKVVKATAERGKGAARVRELNEFLEAEDLISRGAPSVSFKKIVEKKELGNGTK